VINVKHIKKAILIITILLLLFVIGCEKQEEEKSRIGVDQEEYTTSCKCMANYEPVCSTDNVTYDNECWALCDKKMVAYNDVCEQDLICGGMEHKECLEGYTCNVSIQPGHSDIGECYIKEENATVCLIDGMTYYVKKDIVYHTDNVGREYVEDAPGTYRRKDDHTGWVFKHYFSSGDTFYEKTLTAIETGITAHGTTVTCDNSTEIPEGFQAFFDTHPVK